MIKDMMKEQIIQNVTDRKLIAIVRGMDPGCMAELADALYKGGINMMEVTFQQGCDDHYQSTISAISSLRKATEGKMYIGAGTVLSREQVDLAQAAGAEYIVTPTTNPEVIQYAADHGLVTMPGAMTPTEIEQAYEAGADFVKVFPAGELGPGYIKAVRAPLRHIPLLAVGGINEKNIPDFLKAGVTGFGVGGNLVNKSWIEAGQFDRITDLARAYVDSVRK